MSAFLFAATAVLWGSSAIVTGHQAISGAPEVSVGYRMALVSLVMFGWSIARGEKIGLRQIDRPWVMLQGILFFGLAFITFYHSTRLVTSGISALILSTSSLFAVVLGWWFMSAPVTVRMLLGLMSGIVGLAVIALPQLLVLSSNTQAITGVAFALAAAACTGCGTVVAMRNQHAGIPISVLMSWAALCGAVFSFALALFGDASFKVDISATYLAGLAYLAIIASCVTFFMYFSLVQRIGPASASYTLALVPVVALLLSALFEHLVIDVYVVAGGAAVLVGNILVLSAQGKHRAPAKVAQGKGTSS